MSVDELDTRVFLDAFLPLSDSYKSLPQDILTRLQDQEEYSSVQAKWSDLPSLNSEPTDEFDEFGDQETTVDKAEEASICTSLTRIIHMITFYTKETVKPGEDHLSGHWVNTHDQPLRTWHEYEEDEELKPDITFTFDSFREATSQAGSRSNPSQPEPFQSPRPSKTTNQSSTDAPDIEMSPIPDGESAKSRYPDVLESPKSDSEHVREAQNNAPEVLWSQAYTVIEVKTKEARTQLLAQLSTYVRRILAEQVDRLYVIALSLCTNFLRVYLFDRSGIVGTERPIDIHKDPEHFIQVIASFSYLPAARLGWDPTCQIWDKESGNDVDSYALPPTAFQNRSAHDIPWVFDHEYVVIDVITLARSQRISGRGTGVFRVVRLEDWRRMNTQAEIYILKQQWQKLPGMEGDSCLALNNAKSTGPLRPHGQDNLVEKHGLYSTPYEAFIIREAGLHDRLEKAWFVEVEGWKVDTCKFIRKGQTKIVPPFKTEQQPTDETIITKRSSGSRGYTRPAATIWAEIHLTPARIAARAATGTEDRSNHPGPISRTLCRMVLKLPGWPIERLASRLELLNSLRGIVCELEEMYKKGIVHRDVSLGNVLISEDGGHIIDFDHSKFTPNQKPFSPKKDVRLTTRNQVKLGMRMDEDDGQFAIDIGGKRANEYVDAVEEIWYPDGSEEKLTIDDLGWPKERYPLPDFGGRPLGPGFLTGTLAFASCHIGGDGHNAIHDLDSLWWTVAYIPLHYAGPGGERENPPNDIINKYYSGPDAKRSLYRLYGNDGRVGLDKIFANFSPYFSDFVPLMRQWFTFLTVAFYYPGYEYYYPHCILLKILDEAIEREKQNGPETDTSYLEVTLKEHERRDDEKRDTQKAISEQLTVPDLRRRKREKNKALDEAQLAIEPHHGTHQFELL